MEAASIRPVTGAKTGVTVTVRRGVAAVAAATAAIRSMLPLESFSPMMLACSAERSDQIDRQVVVRELGMLYSTTGSASGRRRSGSR